MKRMAEAWINEAPALLWAYEETFQFACHQNAVPAFVFKLWCIREGSAKAIGPGEEWRGCQDDWVHISPRVSRHYVARGTRLLSVAIMVPRRLSRALAELPALIPLERSNTLRTKSQRLVACCTEYLSPDSVRAQMSFRALALDDWAKIRIVYLEWLTSWYQLVRSYAEQLDDPPVTQLAPVLEMMEEALPGPLPPIQQLADASGLSRRRLEQLFLVEHHHSPSRYYDQLRLEEATRRLVSSGVAVKAIAYELEFRHQSHFCQWFRKRAGVTPSQYRERFRRLG